MYGKWHVGMFHEDYQPHRRGFDHFLGFLTGGADFWTHRKCYDSAFGMRCGYDFREANATSATEEIRKDLKGVYTNDIMIDG